VKICALLLVAALSVGMAVGQSKFDVADVRVSPRTTQPLVRGPLYENGRYQLRLATMLDLIRIAYDVDPRKVVGGPSWLEMDRFDIVAKAPSDSTPASRKLMLQGLLAERFNLVLSKETRPVRAFVLSASERPKVEPSNGPGESRCTSKQELPSSSLGSLSIIYTCRHTTMAEFAERLPSMIGAEPYFNFGEQPLIDGTELKGAWNFTFRFTLKSSGEIPLFDALDKQLGLKMQSSMIPMPVVVVDKVNRQPAENSPDGAKSLPPVTAQFEVASVRPSVPTADADIEVEIQHDRINLRRITLKDLIVMAWDLEDESRLIGAPDWLDRDQFDINAKISGMTVGVLSRERSPEESVDIDAVNALLRSLIEERFKLVARIEVRPVDSYGLITANPKLTKADPASRTKCEPGPSSYPRGFSCQNVTMAQFATLLPTIAPDYFEAEPVDDTKLDGSWDFTLGFSPQNVAERGAGVSIFTALKSQLGLELKMGTHPLPVLVIDHIERKPTAN
jgi:uncharacterized protein (TIGR03435 family)